MYKSYTYDTRDDLATITDALDPLNDEVFTHSPRQFLATANGPYDDHVYEYDAVGNRDRQLITESGGFVKIYNHVYPVDSNRLDHVNEPARFVRQFTYDAAGNTTYDQRTAVDGYGYTYNDANRMATITKNGVVQAEYKYNAQGQQVVRQLNGQSITVHAVFDLDGNRVAEYNADTGALLAEYVWLNGRPIAAISGGVVYYVRSDHIGRPSFATDGAGAVIWDASYKPFGEVNASTGAPINLRFPGQWFSAESGLNQNWMRDYDPTTGRYIQADPLGLVDGASVYGYARLNPNRYSDVTGLCPPCVAVGIGIELGALGQAALEALILSMAINDGYSKVQKATERKAYSSFCKTPPPPTGDYCEDLKNKLQHAKQCLDMRKTFGDKWFGDNEKGHAIENGNLQNRINNLEDKIRDECPDMCKILGIEN